MVNNCLILNLDERKDLWEKHEGFRRAWTNLGKKCNRLAGINYQTEKNVLNKFIANGRLDLQGTGFRNSKKSLIGELGCYMAHYNAWKHIVDKKLESCLIMEDGVIVINWELEKLIMPKSLDILFVNSEMVPHNEYQVFGYGTQGYVVTYEGAKKLMQECKVLYGPIDIQILHVCKIRKLRASALTTPYITRNNDRLSSIDNTRLQKTDSDLELQTLHRGKQNTDTIVTRIMTNLIRNNVNLDDYIEYTHDYEVPK